MRRTPATPQADALLLATIKAVGIVQPPIISPQQDGGNGYYIQHGHRRVSQAIAAELAEIEVLVADPETDKDALRAIVENVAREGKNPVDLWRSIERLVGLGWTEESIALALAQSVRQIRKLRLLANILRRFSTRWLVATCRASSSCASSPPRPTRNRPRSGRSTSRKRARLPSPGARSPGLSPAPSRAISHDASFDEQFRRR